MSLDVNRLVDAIVAAETGGESDPFVRTRVVPKGGSTAYGPAQITGTLAKDFLERRSDMFSKDEKSYLKRFIKQADKFSQFGNEPDKKGYDPRYDYGGQGDLTSEADRETYNSIAKKMIGYTYTKNNQDLDSTLLEWRFGANTRKTISSDAKYFKKIQDQLVDMDMAQEGIVLEAPLVDIEGEVREGIQAQLAQEKASQGASQKVSGVLSEERRAKIVDMLRRTSPKKEEKKEFTPKQLAIIEILKRTRAR
ncbi:MAG: hypothetical protein JSW41_04620 [Candidatus Aenigmatarchaeota archaeon]|nr:MAG: hypothetical protein JSW41_04620 [Candidatus Aenigmarchaeota archaeon]